MGSSLLLGEFNIYIDIPTDPFTKTNNEVVYAFNLKQHVREATHEKDHILHLVISRSNDKIAIKQTHIGDFLSDYRAVHSLQDLKKPDRIFNETRYRKINKINTED